MSVIVLARDGSGSATVKVDGDDLQYVLGLPEPGDVPAGRASEWAFATGDGAFRVSRRVLDHFGLA